MKNTFGNNVQITIFGESHGEAVGAVLDGLPGGIDVDEDFIRFQLSLRRPSGEISTPRCEQDNFVIQSGVFNGKTTGSPICIIIPNENKKSMDYNGTQFVARPGHADYTANCKYHGFQDYRGGGHFSGRITAAIVAAGAIVIKALQCKNIFIGTHIKRCCKINDRDFIDITEDLNNLNNKMFAVLDDDVKQSMVEQIINAKNDGDSVGGILETAVSGLPAGIGEPWFDTVEGLLSHALFSIPAVKGVEFGDGFGIADKRGSEANDGFYYNNSKVCTDTNNNGGINGGITNGMPLLFKCAVKPTPTIHKEQNTINFNTKQNTTLTGAGRHDPCIVHRARVVVDSITAITLCDLLLTAYGTDWMVK